jgi:hypothetical protein
MSHGELRWCGELDYWGAMENDYWVWIDHTELTARRATNAEVAGWPEDEYYDDPVLERDEDLSGWYMWEIQQWIDKRRLRDNVDMSHDAAAHVTGGQRPRRQ